MTDLDPTANIYANASSSLVVVLAEYQHGKVTARCNDLAEYCELPVVDSCSTPEQLLLTWIDDALTLCQGSQYQLKTSVDFASGKSLHRLQYGGGYKQPLARAVSIKASSSPLICDATGGMGRDAFVFATLGCKVVILEKSPIVFSLLADGLKRALHNPDVNSIAANITIHRLDSTALPDVWPYAKFPDTVYLDPMYPHNRKNAAVKKEMRLLQQLNLGEADENLLLSQAMATAKHRVAVKRPLKAAPLQGVEPSGSIKSPNTRYDIYPGLKA